MVYNCWSFGSGSGPGCVPGYYRTWSIDNIGNNPLLPVPTYITRSFSACLDTYQLPPYHEEARKLWTTFCDPPRATYPITNIGSWPTTPTPYSMDIIRDPSTAALPDYYLDRGFAIACRIIPTSKCLPYIIFHYAYNQTVSPNSINTIIEIRKNDPATNLPMGIPGDMNIFGKVNVGFTTDIYSYAVPINTILDDIDVPVWIVLYSTDYACSGAYVGTRRVKLRKSDVTVDNNVAVFSEANGCTWAIDTTIKSLSLVTYKSTSCNGTVVVNDFAFAQIAQPPIYLNSNCFVRLQDVQGSKVAIGVIYTNPDPVRTWKRVRLSFAYLKPDLRYFTQTIDIFNVSPGQHEVFFEMNDSYFPGKYDQLAVSAAVIQV
jgi:hypothetical protein